MLVCTLADTSLVKKLSYHQTAGKMETIPRRSSEAKKMSYNPTKSQITINEKKIQLNEVNFPLILLNFKEK